MVDRNGFNKIREKVYFLMPTRLEVGGSTRSGHCAGFVVLWKPSRVRVELLPFTDSPPEWNRSYPCLLISIDPDPGYTGFKSSTLLIDSKSFAQEAPFEMQDSEGHRVQPKRDKQ